MIECARLGGCVTRSSRAVAALVLNEQGYERFKAVGLDEVHVTFAATESFSQRNANASIEDAVATVDAILSRASADGMRATTTISVSFGCPFEGGVDPGRVLELGRRAAAAVAAEVVAAARRTPPRHTEHSHRLRVRRSRGWGDRVRCLRWRSRRLPVRTERDGQRRDSIETGIDLNALIEVARWLEEQLDRRLDGLVHRAGR